jgi:hypothetical protein
MSELSPIVFQNMSDERNNFQSNFARAELGGVLKEIVIKSTPDSEKVYESENLVRILGAATKEVADSAFYNQQQSGHNFINGLKQTIDQYTSMEADMRYDLVMKRLNNGDWDYSTEDGRAKAHNIWKKMGFINKGLVKRYKEEVKFALSMEGDDIVEDIGKEVAESVAKAEQKAEIIRETVAVIEEEKEKAVDEFNSEFNNLEEDTGGAPEGDLSESPVEEENPAGNTEEAVADDSLGEEDIKDIFGRAGLDYDDVSLDDGSPITPGEDDEYEGWDHPEASNVDIDYVNSQTADSEAGLREELNTEVRSIEELLNEGIQEDITAEEVSDAEKPTNEEEVAEKEEKSGEDPEIVPEVTTSDVEEESGVPEFSYSGEEYAGLIWSGKFMKGNHFTRKIFKNFADMVKSDIWKAAVRKAKDWAEDHNLHFAKLDEVKRNKETIGTAILGGMFTGGTKLYQPTYKIVDGLVLSLGQYTKLRHGNEETMTDGHVIFARNKDNKLVVRLMFRTRFTDSIGTEGFKFFNYAPYYSNTNIGKKLFPISPTKIDNMKLPSVKALTSIYCKGEESLKDYVNARFDSMKGFLEIEKDKALTDKVEEYHKRSDEAFTQAKYIKDTLADAGFNPFGLADESDTFNIKVGTRMLATANNVYKTKFVDNRKSFENKEEIVDAIFDLARIKKLAKKHKKVPLNDVIASREGVLYENIAVLPENAKNDVMNVLKVSELDLDANILCKQAFLESLKLAVSNTQVKKEFVGDTDTDIYEKAKERVEAAFGRPMDAEEDEIIKAICSNRDSVDYVPSVYEKLTIKVGKDTLSDDAELGSESEKIRDKALVLTTLHTFVNNTHIMSKEDTEEFNHSLVGDTF